MSNSPLVSYTKISPNRTSPRNHVIDTITIHCVVGQCSVETLGNIFSPTSRKASCNYGIGYDGKIGMYCEEKDRSWCSSSSKNDNRAITIEVASDTYHPYRVNDKVYASLINLLADICRRNNIKRLLWKADKSLVGQVDKQNMTVHRWFAKKACPGDYLYNLHFQIAEEVNKKLGTSVIIDESNNVSTENNNSTEKLIYNWLKKNTTFNTAAISGILANLYHESAFKSTNLQNSYEKSLGYTDESYTSAVDSNKYKNFIRDSAGYGLAQWTFWSRKQGLLEYANSKKTSIGDYTMQLEYLLKELKNYKNVWNILSNCSDDENGAYQSGYRFCYDFEAPAAKATSSVTRGNKAKEYYKKYKDSKTEESTSIEALYESIDVGDILEFTGNKQYTSAGANTSRQAKPCKVKVTRKYLESSKHPIHVRAVNEEGKYISGVYGWVDISDLKLILSSSFLVKVTVDKLNYRGGPSTSYAILGTIEDRGIYTIVQEKNGWGQLKSKLGWISLKYTERV